jgi:cyanophycin synthetase
LVIDNKLVAAAKTVPAHVRKWRKFNSRIIATENLDPKRGYGHENVLTQIDVNRDTEDLLKTYTLETIPEMGDVVYLKSTIQYRRHSVDVTDMLHPENIF